VPNPFTANWIEQHYQSDLAASATLCAKKPMQVVVSIDPSLSGQCSKRKLDIQADIVSRTTQGRARHRAPIKSPTLRHTLDEFVVGECNELAYQAAKSAVSGAGHFSQIFVHGPCGVGKTHLLQGICNTLSRRDGKDGQPLRWRYVTGEQFTNEFIVAVRNRKGNEFRNRYRGLDLLAIDDVHFLAAKRATQSEFLHTFNAIEAAGKQIILASDTHPRLVGELNEQLVSRFMSGLVVKIEAPDKQTRMAILKRKAKQLKLKLNTDVLEYIALHIRASVRELEGTLVKLSALAALENGKITLEISGHSFVQTNPHSLRRPHDSDVPGQTTYADELPGNRTVHGKKPQLGSPGSAKAGQSPRRQGRAKLEHASRHKIHARSRYPETDGRTNRVKSCQLSVKSYQLSVISYQ